jgi:hypothetical protein
MAGGFALGAGILAALGAGFAIFALRRAPARPAAPAQGPGRKQA